MSERKEYRLSDLMQIKYGKDHKHLADGTYPLYGSGGIMRYVEKPLYDDESILIPRKGTLSNLFYLDQPFWSVDTMFYSKINKNLVLPKYLFYTLKTFDLASLNVGSAVPSLTTEVLNEVLVSIPDLPIQTAIAEILSSLDDKIELNNKINQELEALAQTLFKRWFVDFEFPNENGEPYKSSGGEMMQSELGEIPKGWEKRKFTDCFEVSRGVSYNGAGLTDSTSGIPMINLNSVIEGGGYKEEGIKFYNGKYKESHLINSWEIAVANTEQGHKYLLIGYPAFVPKYIGSIAIFSHHIYKVKSKLSSYLTNQFIYYLIKQNHIREQIIGACNGTTVNMLKSFGLGSPIFTQPPKSLVKYFTDLVTNVWETYELNTLENKNLTNLRDTLLPKLISGELEVSDIQASS